MSPHNCHERKTRRGARVAAVCLLGLVFAAHARHAAEAAPVLRDGEVRRAEKVIARLRLLYGAADAGDANAYRTLMLKFYPGLFVTVAELRQADLSTDLSTAVFLAEELGRKWDAGGAASHCGRERPDIYLPLCLDQRGGAVRLLLLAKARLHTHWAAAVVRIHRGESDVETERALREMAAARANDALIAERVLKSLRPLEGLLRQSAAGVDGGGRLAASAAGFDNSDGEFADALRVAGELLSWMPRGPAFYRLSGARQAYADGLSWHRKARQSKRLVVSANSFAPDLLKVLGLDADQAGAAAAAGWKSAARLSRLTEKSLLKAAH